MTAIFKREFLSSERSPIVMIGTITTKKLLSVITSLAMSTVPTANWE